MRLAKKIFLIVLIVIIVAYAAACIFISVQGKRIVIARVVELTGRQVQVGSVRMSGPLRFTIDKISVDGIGKAASIEISPGLFALLAGKADLHSILIVKPEITFTMPGPAPTAVAAAPQEGSAPAQEKSPSLPKAVAQVCPRTPFMFHSLRIVDGTIVYADPSVSPDTGGIKITLTNVDARVTNIYEFPNETVTKFELTSQIPWKDSQERGAVSLDGWMNYSKKDMRAELVMKDIDALYLYPYYASWFSLDKGSIAKAKLAFTSSVTGLNNDVTAACHLEVTELSFKQGEEASEQTRSEKIAKKVLGFLKAMNNGKVEMNFSFKTKMDSPDFGLNVIKSACDNTLMQVRKAKGATAAKVMEMPGQVVGGTVRGVTDVSSALIGGVVSMGKEIGRSFGASFRKEPPPSTSVSQTAQEPNATAVPQQPVETAAVNETVSTAAPEGNTTPAGNVTPASQPQEPGNNTTNIPGNNTTGQ